MEKRELQVDYREKMYTHLVAVILFCICIFRYNVMRNPYFTPDEVGYWAAGAWLYGIDWSPIFSNSAYYGWGYGILLAPLFKINDTALKFQMAVVINVVLLITCYYLLIAIAKEVFITLDYKKRSLISAVTILYSYHLAYAHLSMCEVFLTFLFILSACMLVDICKKATVLNISFLAFLVILQIATHLRMLILPIVFIFVFGYMLITKKIKIRYVFIFFSILILGIFFVYQVKDILIEWQYTAKNLGFENEVNSRPSTNESILFRLSVFGDVLTLNFWKKFFFSILGKVFYLGCASFFTVIFGFKYIVFNIAHNIKQLIKKEKQDNNWIGVWIYLTFSFLGALALNVISLMYSSRYDHLFYGRYVENTVAIVIFIGIMEVVEHKVKIKEVLLCLALSLISAILLCFWIKHNNYAGVLPLECAGFAGLFQKENWDFANQFTIYIVLIIILIFCILYYLLNRKRNVGIVSLGIIWSIIAYRGLDLYIYPEIGRMEAVVEIAEGVDLQSEKVWTLIPNDTNAYITAFVDAMWLQFQLDDRTVHVLAEEHLDELGEDDILVISKYYPDVQNILKSFELLFENSQMFILKAR